MRRMTAIVGMALAVALGYSLQTVTCRAAEGEEDAWDHKFNGHEMWLTSLDEGLAKSAKESKPLLIDLYSRH